MEDTRRTSPPESTEEGSYELTATEAANISLFGSAPRCLHIYYMFQLSVTMGLLKCELVDL